MALVLNKIRNDADAYFRPRPAGLAGIMPLFVATFRQAGACLHSGAAIDLMPESQRYNRLVQRFPSYMSELESQKRFVRTKLLQAKYYTDLVG